jgi:hypothetical protein
MFFRNLPEKDERKVVDEVRGVFYGDFLENSTNLRSKNTVAQAVSYRARHHTLSFKIFYLKKHINNKKLQNC